MYFLPSSSVPDALIGTSPNQFIGKVVGSFEDIQANGTNASSYLQCRIPSENGNKEISNCGEPVPEPLTILGTGVVLGAIPVLKKEYAKRKKKKDGDA